MVNHATGSGSKVVEVWTPFSAEYFAKNMLLGGGCTNKHHEGCQNPESWKSIGIGFPTPTPSCAYGRSNTPVGQIGAERIANWSRCHRLRVIVQEIEPGEEESDDQVFGIPTEGEPEGLE